MLSVERFWGASRLAGVPELSKQARQRLKWMDYNQHNGNARLTVRLSPS